jgi:multidrug efflux pump subunit AcrB
MFFLSGVSRYLFVPLAEAVVFAMLASYLLSRTVVPTMAKYLLKEHDDAQTPEARASRNPFTRFQAVSSHYFEKFAMATCALAHFVRGPLWRLSHLFLVLSPSLPWAFLLPELGQDFFPSVDAGQFKIHVRARTGTRIEETAALCDHIDHTIREQHSGQGSGHDRR